MEIQSPEAFHRGTTDAVLIPEIPGGTKIYDEITSPATQLCRFSVSTAREPKRAYLYLSAHHGLRSIDAMQIDAKIDCSEQQLV